LARIPIHERECNIARRHRVFQWESANFLCPMIARHSAWQLVFRNDPVELPRAPQGEELHLFAAKGGDRIIWRCRPEISD
jgi:hypothetical protein